MRNRRVDDYIKGLPEWQRRLCLELRELIHRADPEIEETIRRKVRPYFVLEGNVCALLAITMLRQIIASNRAGGWRTFRALRS